MGVKQHEGLEDHYKEIAKQVEEQLVRSIAYGERLSWVDYEGEPRLYIGKHAACITTQPGYVLYANTEPIPAVSSVCCKVDANCLVAFAVSGTGSKRRKMMPIFKIAGDFTVVEHHTNFWLFSAYHSEPGRLEVTKERRDERRKRTLPLI